MDVSWTRTLPGQKKIRSQKNYFIKSQSKGNEELLINADNFNEQNNSNSDGKDTRTDKNSSIVNYNYKEIQNESNNTEKSISNSLNKENQSMHKEFSKIEHNSRKEMSKEVKSPNNVDEEEDEKDEINNFSIKNKDDLEKDGKGNEKKRKIEGRR